MDQRRCVGGTIPADESHRVSLAHLRGEFARIADSDGVLAALE